MTARRVRVTPAGWAALAVAGVLVVVGLVVLTARLLPDEECTVEAQGRTVELDRDDAERAATAVATTGAVPRGLDLTSAEADAVAEALSGRTRAAVVCRHGGASTAEPDRLGAAGLTARADVVRRDVRSVFGDVPLGGFAPGGVSDGHMPGSAHYDGRAIDAFFRPVGPRNRTRGWALAHYLVAHAHRLAVETVIFDGRIWTARRAAQGWRDYDVDAAGRTRAVLRVLEHRDHVHVDVAD